MSRIGNKLIQVPSGVNVEVKDGIVHVKGPKGELKQPFSGRINIEVKDGQVFVKRNSDIKTDRALHGLYRSLINNMIKGVTAGYSKEMEIIGVGFKAAVQGTNLNIQLSFSHPVNFPIPQGIKIETPKPTSILISGIDKQLVGKVATEIRSIHPPEPYKGKGIRFAGEYVKKKVGKAQATGGK